MLDAFTVIAEPRRREILEILREGEASVGVLVEHLGLSQPAVSKHLRILRESGMVSVRPEGQQRMYGLDPAPLRELDEWLEPYRRRWSRALDGLERHLASTRGPNHDEGDRP